MFESRGLIKPGRPGVLNETPGRHAVTRNTHTHARGEWRRSARRKRDEKMLRAITTPRLVETRRINRKVVKTEQRSDHKGDGKESVPPPPLMEC